MSQTILTVAVVLTALGIWVSLAVLIVTFVQLRRAAHAVEVLAYKVDDSVSRVHDASRKFGDFADSVRSGWMRALELTLAAVTSMRPGERRAEHEHHDGREGDKSN